MKIYNTSGSLTFDNNGLNITNSKNAFNVNPNANNLLTISQTINGNTENIFYVDENGTLHIKGDGSGLDISANNSITGLSSSLQTTAEQIYATVSQTQSKYNTTGYTISLYGYGNPTATDYPPANHNNEYYLNQTNGTLWLCNGSAWNQSTTLSLITDDLSSEIQQTAKSISSTVSAAVSKYDTTSLEYSINLYGYGVPSNNYNVSDYENQYYLNQSNGYVYKSNGSSWEYKTRLSLITANLQSQIIQNANNITSKVSSGDFGTLIEQNATSVVLSWNTKSNYISFESGQLNIYSQYDSTTKTKSNLLLTLNNSGNTFYCRNNKNTADVPIGKIGVGHWSGDSTKRGLRFGLNEYGDYMSWGYQEEDGTSYYVKLIYYANNRIDKQGLHINDTAYINDNIYISGNAYFAKSINLNDYASLSTYSITDNGTVISQNNVRLYSPTKEISINGKTARVKSSGANLELDEERFIFYTSNSKLVDCYNNIDMHNYSINNNSDIRLKTNIADTEIDALSLLNKVELKSFDWIEDNKHEDIGVIAQQLQEVIPDLISEDKTTTKLSIQPLKFIPYLIKAIQELYTMVESKQTNEPVSSTSKKSVKAKQNKKKIEYTMEEKLEFVKSIKPPEHMQEQVQEERKEFKPLII